MWFWFSPFITLSYISRFLQQNVSECVTVFSFHLSFVTNYSLFHQSYASHQFSISHLSALPAFHCPGNVKSMWSELRHYTNTTHYSRELYYNSSSVCLSVCLFVPLLLRGPLTDLHQTWWVCVGGPPNCPWGVLFWKGQRVTFLDTILYMIADDTRLRPHCCKPHTASFARSTGIFTSK